jgi:hypothetical protein
MAYMYARDEPAIKEWIEANKTADGAQAYLDKLVHGVSDHEEYLGLVGRQRLDELIEMRERRE